jgi:cyanate permease
MHGQFWLLLLGTFCGGLYAAAHNSYRFAAADTASDALRPKVVSWVLAGGVFAAVIGPQLVIFTKDLLPPHLFAASYLGQSACALLAAIVLIFVKMPPVAAKRAVHSRPLSEIARAPRFIVAVACGMASYGMMNMIMTSAPLAMVGCGHSVTDATLGIQWHVLAMYAPSFFTGSLIARFGVERITGIGLGLIALAAVIGISGITVAHFWTVLVLLGIGWNFAFIGATTMVTQCHRPQERNKVQAFNDFLIFGSMAVSSFSSGQLLEYFGWQAINQVVFPTIFIAAAMLLWLSLRRDDEAVA